MKKKNLNEALGPLALVFEDPEITEVMVDGPVRVSVERKGKIEDTGIKFKSNDELRDIIEAVLETIGVEFEEGKTIYDVRLGDNSRMTAILEPVSIDGHCIVFRKRMTYQVTWEKLFEYNCLTTEMRDVIKGALDAHATILVAGGTASGKTTLANRIIELMPHAERIVAAEQSHEYQFEHPRAIFLEASGMPGMTMNELLNAAAKMRPDWLVIGELNGAEAARAMQIFGNGYCGLATIHATSAENALTRLEAMCLMANLGLGLDDIREMITSAMRLVIYQERLPNGKRKIMQMSELCGLENGRYVLRPLARYNPEADQFELTGEKPGWEK